jgi:dienelactone hydrolase
MVERPGVHRLLLVIAVAACSHSTPARFDLTAARRPDLQAAFGPRRDAGNGISLEEVSFQSTQWRSDGQSSQIRIRAVLARPVAPGRRPAVIVVHGLGAKAEPDVAVEIARNLDAVALTLSAPGLGGSEGEAVTFEDPRPLFATVPDVRGSWLYAYVFAVLRGITLVQGLPDVQGPVVLSGTSLGGIASLVANGVDDRIGGVLAMSASGGIEDGARRGSWFATLVKSAGGLQLADRQVRSFFAALDPLAFAGTQHGAVVLLSGAQDEFFPMDQVMRTFQALQAPAKSIALVPDYDHGWYFATGCPARCMPGAPQPATDCPADCPSTCPGRWPYCGPQASYNRQDEVMGRWALLLRSLVARVSGRPFDPPPPVPLVERRGDDILVMVGMVKPKAVRVAISDNGGFTYGQVLVPPQPDGSYVLHRPLPSGAIVIAEVEGPDGAVVTSLPELPGGFVPPIRPFAPVPR